MSEFAEFDRTSQVTHFAEYARWAGVVDHDRAAWLAARTKYLTASDTAAIMGEDPRRSAFAVYWDKIQPREAEVVSIESPMFWGKVLEQPILSAVAEYYGWEYRKGGALLESRKYPWLAATLDSEIDRGSGFPEILEGKTTAFMLRGDWDEEAGEMPVRVVLQVQHQMLVTGAEGAAVFCLVGGQGPCLINVEPEPEIHAIIVEESERFMEMLRNREEPPPGPQDGDTLERLYPIRGDGIVQLTGTELEWSREVVAIQAQRKEIEKREKTLKNALKRSIANATWGKLPEAIGGFQFWKWYTTQNKLLLLKNGPKVRGEIPTALPVALNESPVVEEDECAETTKAPAKKRRKARR